jgi:hypothetical protein
VAVDLPGLPWRHERRRSGGESAHILEESRIAASLNHPHVISIHNMPPGSGLLYIVNRYVSGTGPARIFASLFALFPSSHHF